MVKEFAFARFPGIYFRNGKLAELPWMISKYGHSILLVTGRSSFMNSDRARDFLTASKNLEISCHHVVVPGEPSPQMIDQVTERFKNEKIHAVVAIGGGSVIDAGKAISAMILMNAPVKDFLEGVGTRDHPGTKLPFIAVPTTSGTGSEATKNAVISEIGPAGFKKSLRHDHFVPDIAVVDPELTLDCPKHITAASGMDCFTQLVEAYLSDKSSLITDALALEGLKALKGSLLQAVTDGHNLEARSGMSFAALTSGICLANAGLGVVHGFASSIGGMFPIPHGLVCGTLMASVNDMNIKKLRKNNENLPALYKYSSLGKLFLVKEGKPDEYYIDGFIHYLHKLSDDLQIPGLKSSGLAEKDISLVCSLTEMKNNPVILSQEDLVEIIRSRMF